MLSWNMLDFKLIFLLISVHYRVHLNLVIIISFSLCTTIIIPDSSSIFVRLSTITLLYIMGSPVFLLNLSWLKLDLVNNVWWNRLRNIIDYLHWYNWHWILLWLIAKSNPNVPLLLNIHVQCFYAICIQLVVNGSNIQAFVHHLEEPLAQVT